jgi:glycosyltransferase involved in cell wall biosynthesis
LIGEITDETNFKEYLEDFFHQNPYLKSRIIFTGNISQIEVFEWYKRAKYLVMSSRREGFAHVFAEAAYFSTLIISRDVGGVRDITNDGEF